MTHLEHDIATYGDDVAHFKENAFSQSWIGNRIISMFPKNDCKVLDLGVGHGIMINLLSEHFKDYSVIDADQDIIEMYKRNYPKSNANIIKAFFEDFQSTEKYDLIFMNNILEHVDDPVLILKKYAQYLIEDGSIIINVPNAECMHRRLGVFMGVLDDIKKFSEIDIAYGHKRYYTIETIKSDIEESGLRVKKTEGVYLKPFTTKQIDSLSLSNDVYDALFNLGVFYPELSNSLFVQCIKQ